MLCDQVLFLCQFLRELVALASLALYAFGPCTVGCGPLLPCVFSFSFFLGVFCLVVFWLFVANSG